MDPTAHRSFKALADPEVAVSAPALPRDHVGSECPDLRQDLPHPVKCCISTKGERVSTPLP